MQGEINAKIDLSKAMDKLLEQYGKEIRETVNEQVLEVGKETVKKLKQRKDKTTSRSRKKYAKGWTDYTEISWNGTTMIIYNKNKPQLTHLLNNGFEWTSRSGVREKTVKGDGHINDASDFANELLVSRVERSLK